MLLHLWNSKIHDNRQTITRSGKLNLFYTKLSKVNKVQNMLISTWTNAVMFRVNVQNVLCRLQCRLSVACAIYWSRCQSLPGPDGPILPRHAGIVLPRPWSGGGCTHTLVGSPTPGSQWGSDHHPTVRRPCLSYQDCEPCAADRYRTTFGAAGSVNLTQYSFNSIQRPVFIPKHSHYFCCSVELMLS